MSCVCDRILWFVKTIVRFVKTIWRKFKGLFWFLLVCSLVWFLIKIDLLNLLKICFNCLWPFMLFSGGIVGLWMYLLGVAFPRITKDSILLKVLGIYFMLTVVILTIEYLFFNGTWFIQVTYLGILALIGIPYMILYIKSEEKKLQEKKLHLRPPVQVQEPTPVQKEENLEVQSGRNWTKYLYATSYNSYSYYIC